MTLVKICGVNSAVAFDAAVEAGADFIGFNFFRRSPRYVTPTEGAALSARHSGGSARIGLFVSPTDDEVAVVLDRMSIDALQLYATTERTVAIREKFGVPVWAAIGVATAADLPRSTAADRLVVEAKAPADATRPGGNAIAFDWSLLSGWSSPAPWLLAGGLDAANVADAIRATAAPGVDVSSGVERAPGIKEPTLIRAFIAAARAA